MCDTGCVINSLVGGDHAYCDCLHHLTAPAVAPSRERVEVSSCVPIGCYRCLGGPFYWGKTERGWRLVDDYGIVHKCAEYMPIT